MSYVNVAPESIATAAADVAGIGSMVSAAHTAAASPTVALLPAAADEVSAGISQLFSEFADGYHTLAARAGSFLDGFVGNLKAGAFSYAAAEAGNATNLAASATAAAVTTNPLQLLIDFWHALTDPILVLIKGLYAVAALIYQVFYSLLVLDWLFANLIIAAIAYQFGL